ncbi:hypothetical protein ABZ079_28125 [Streptomyces sp. NPDC006314]|uniref:hypothetical protein n=1 Tax=Streptomyces sp. NPDC006314 TaxID=3154475 RepID=UPI0033A8AE13
MESTGVGAVVVFLVAVCAPGVSSVLHGIAFRIRAAGKAELMRARRESGGEADSARRAVRRGWHG